LYHATGLTGWQRASQDWYPESTGPAPYPPAYSQSTPQDEARMIRSQIEALEANIEAAQQRLTEIETDSE
jgi:hypothetical protein